MEQGFISVLMSSTLDEKPRVKELRIPRELLEQIKDIDDVRKFVHREVDRMFDILIGGNINE